MNGMSLPQGGQVRYKSVLQGVQGPDFIYCSTGLVGQQMPNNCYIFVIFGS